jgi:hypothetical protein
MEARMKTNRLVLGLAVLFISSALIAGGNKENIGTWTLLIEGVPGVTQFTSADAAKLKSVTIEMTITNSRGESRTNSYTGIPLKAILNAIGAKNVSSLKVAASDGFEAVYDAKLINADDTLLAWAMDGQLLEGEAPLRMSPKQGVGNQFVRNTAKIVVQ